MARRRVVQRIKAVETETRLLVVDKETDEYLCSLRLTCTEEMVHSGVLLGSGVSPTKSVGSDNGEVWKPQLDLSGGSLQRHSHSFSSHGSRKDLNGQKELCPRLCHLKKGPNGYGFNLHSEKSRPGQFIRSVDPDSPASRAGLRPQDRLVEVNGINVEGLRHSEVVSHIKARESEARLLVVDPETDDYFKKLGVTPTEEHTKVPGSRAAGPIVLMWGWKREGTITPHRSVLPRRSLKVQGETLGLAPCACRGKDFTRQRSQGRLLQEMFPLLLKPGRESSPAAPRPATGRELCSAQRGALLPMLPAPVRPALCRTFPVRQVLKGKICPKERVKPC
eukprot:XP_027324731.1 Na(+)/H(+) exchange regulatory cofactor NHE-RF2 isoform X3 [Anas platyrhynchos]